jgi:hypothetical protein
LNDFGADLQYQRAFPSKEAAVAALKANGYFVELP